MSAYSEVLNAFNDITGDTGRYHFSTAQVDRFANRALEEIGERSRHITESKLINVVGGTSEYSIDADAYDVIRVEYDEEVLHPITRGSLRHADRDWSSRTGLPRYYYLDEITSNQNYLTVGLWETPSSSMTTGLRIMYHAVPTAVSTASSVSLIEVPDWACSAVLYYMLNIAYTADTKMQDFGAAALYEMMYQDVLERLILRSRDQNPKKWVSGSASGPSRNILNRLPQRITP